MKDARKAVKHVRKNFRLRQQEIREARRTIILEKICKAEELQIKRLQTKGKQTADTIYWGLWQTEQQVDDGLATITGKNERTKALKAELSFRKNVLKQKPSDPSLKNMYAFTKLVDGRYTNLEVWQLAHNVKQLIQHAHHIDVNQAHRDDDGDTPIIVGRRVID